MAVDMVDQRAYRRLSGRQAADESLPRGGRLADVLGLG